MKINKNLICVTVLLQLSVSKNLICVTVLLQISVSRDRTRAVHSGEALGYASLSTPPCLLHELCNLLVFIALQVEKQVSYVRSGSNGPR